jgi:hypothetical protein
MRERSLTSSTESPCRQCTLAQLSSRSHLIKHRRWGRLRIREVYCYQAVCVCHQGTNSPCIWQRADDHTGRYTKALDQSMHNTTSINWRQAPCGVQAIGPSYALWIQQQGPYERLRLRRSALFDDGLPTVRLLTAVPECKRTWLTCGGSKAKRRWQSYPFGGDSGSGQIKMATNACLTGLTDRERML